MSELMSSEFEKQQLHKTIWGIANDLRGAVDGWDFKAYVLGMMAYRYLSEHFAGSLNKTDRDAGGVEFDYAKLSDAEAEADLGPDGRAELIDTMGYVLLPSLLFENVEARCDTDVDLNTTLKNAFREIEHSSEGTKAFDMFDGLFSDLDLNSNKLGATTDVRNQRLRKILHAVAGMKLGNYMETRVLDYSANANDMFGDAYEYLMAMYASNAGKSGGEFYTPQEVAELLALIVTENGTRDVKRCYDPTCGSGGLLLKFVKVLGHMCEQFCGQEINITTYNLCRINMLLHGMNYSNLTLCCGDTLMSPDERLDEWRPFDAIVSNPPYSVKWAGDGDTRLVNDVRFAGPGKLAPKSRADLAFVMHSLHWLDEKGIAAIVCFPGVLYRTGAEAKIRAWLVEQGHIDAVIQLPEKLFFGAGIATSILVMKKGLSDGKTLFIDASAEFVSGTNQNKLSDENIQKIVKALLARQDIDHFCKLADKDAIRENEYNLSVSMYVEKKDTREKIDIDVLNARIADTVQRESVLRGEIDQIVAMLEAGRRGQIGSGDGVDGGNV